MALPGDLLRLARAGYVLAREGVLTVMPFPQPMPAGLKLALVFARLIQRRTADEKDGSARITAALNRLGPSYVKLGQFLATRPDVVGKQFAIELSALQDNVPAFDDAVARREIELALGRPVEALFAEFGPPIAAASIAQVHRAEVEDEYGTRKPVAVKVLRPNVQARFLADLSGFYRVARLVERFHRPSQRLRPVAVVDTLARSVALEMDFRLEAAALSEMAENIAHDEGFRVPGVDWTRSAKSVLVMEWIEGRKLSNLSGIEADGHDMPALGRLLMQSFLRHALRDGFFHADMHQGNLFVEPDGTLVAVDFGIMGRLGVKERRFLAEILYGFIIRDYTRVAEVHFEAGYVPPHHDVASFAQALRAIGEPLQGHTAADISMARLLNQLFEVTDLFDMATRPELIMLQKTMVVVEGVARTLDPHLDMWKTADPVVRGWIERNLGPVGRIEEAGGHIKALWQLAETLPVLAERATRIAARFDADETAEKAAMHVFTPMTNVALWIGALSLMAIAIGMWAG
ncbi:putative ubiquinone biosynthesis protein UbiB [Hartmannibacter diazotrophicus]|uniref:Putative ubiquinone biosynthesis protein UbiB n=1 Tax=Hartmannibacter diazotrophicus TaxID=1482074 RepID=A0A2C9DDZ8_9HYPH|nr:2-polyprenylphenol 6-hydroxylase [Hartmannibacter diazotrophicus]SON58400.1 putative ubiquinone biosynthesis protein UbiB [Hartmannibacter diazotrophicus]